MFIFLVLEYVGVDERLLIYLVLFEFCIKCILVWYLKKKIEFIGYY